MSATERSIAVERLLNTAIHAESYKERVDARVLIIQQLNEREQLREALRGVAIMLNTELEKYDKEPWAQRVRAALSDQNGMREG